MTKAKTLAQAKIKSSKISLEKTLPDKTSLGEISLGEVYEILDSISPFSLQESWDNSGINLGHSSQKITQIFLALEADLQIAQNLPPNSLLITHHPIIFSPLKSFDPTDYPAKILQILIQKNCALIAMHTNFDKTHLNEYFAKEILGFDSSSLCSDNLSRFCALPPTPIASLAQMVKSSLSLKSLTYSTPSEDFLVSQVYFVCGSGASFWRKIAQGQISQVPQEEAQDKLAFGKDEKSSQMHPATTRESVAKQNTNGGICLITSDIKYHDAMSAKCANIALIDATHYASERHFAPLLHNNLHNNLQIKHLNCIMLENFSPFSYI